MTKSSSTSIERAQLAQDSKSGSPALAGGGVSTERIWEAVERFAGWLEREGFESYDPYDVWGTAYGLAARRLYYQRHPLGFLLVAPVLALETLAPGLRRVFVRKQRFATADAQLLLAFLNLHALTGEAVWLDKARGLGADLLRISIPGYAGHGWGYPFDWQNNRGLWRKNTPYITATPYCYEAFVRLFEVTGEESHRTAAASAARFVFADLKDTPDGNGAAAASYSPIDDTKVVNASAYRAFVLFDAAARFNLPHYRDKALKNLEFILRRQGEDGSWLYAIDAPGEAFIDHFHTCFVLKNLFKINRLLAQSEDLSNKDVKEVTSDKDPSSLVQRVRDAIRKGYDYYRSSLFEADEEPRSFAIKPRLQIGRLEMYNMAEAITLGVLLRDELPGALDLAMRLADRLVTQFQLPAGHFVTRVSRGGIRHGFPFLRWPQAQLFYALTNLLAVTEVHAPEHAG